MTEHNDEKGACGRAVSILRAAAIEKMGELGLTKTGTTAAGGHIYSPTQQDDTRLVLFYGAAAGGDRVVVEARRDDEWDERLVFTIDGFLNEEPPPPKHRSPFAPGLD